MTSATALLDQRVGHVANTANCADFSGRWVRGEPLHGSLAVSTLLIDATEAEALDLRAAGFEQWFADLQTPLPVGAGGWLVTIPTAYDVELVRRQDFSPGRPQQPAQLSGTFLDPHPPRWVEHITADGVAVIVVPGLTDLDVVGIDDLRTALCALAPAVCRH